MRKSEREREREREREIPQAKPPPGFSDRGALSLRRGEVSRSDHAFSRNESASAQAERRTHSRRRARRGRPEPLICIRERPESRILNPMASEAGKRGILRAPHD